MAEGLQTRSGAQESPQNLNGYGLPDIRNAKNNARGSHKSESYSTRAHPCEKIAPGAAPVTLFSPKTGEPETDEQVTGVPFFRSWVGVRSARHPSVMTNLPEHTPSPETSKSSETSKPSNSTPETSEQVAFVPVDPRQVQELEAHLARQRAAMGYG